MKHLKTPQELNEASENLNISDVSRSYSLDDLRNAFEEGYLLYNNEGNKYMGFGSEKNNIKKSKRKMMDKPFNKFIENNYD